MFECQRELLDPVSSLIFQRQKIPVHIKQINILSACFTFKIENELHLNDNKVKHVKSFL